MQDLRQPIAVAVREALCATHNRGLTNADTVKLDAFCDDVGIPRVGTASNDPAWLTVGRALIGTKEVPGPTHNSFIAKGWARLGAGWFKDDETPWCGFFVAHCIDAAGLPYPGRGEFARALSWAGYGVACTPRPGAIGVKTRNGGGHVFFILGETADGRRFVVLEGNADNMVRIGSVAKVDVIAMRWPLRVLQHDTPLPKLAAGSVSTSEA